MMSIGIGNRPLDPRVEQNGMQRHRLTFTGSARRVPTKRVSLPSHPLTGQALQPVSKPRETACRVTGAI